MTFNPQCPLCNGFGESHSRDCPAAAEVREQDETKVELLPPLPRRILQAATIERCAQVAENTPCLGYGKEPGEVIAAAIRALKEKP